MKKKCFDCGKKVSFYAVRCPVCAGKTRLGENNCRWTGGKSRLEIEKSYRNRHPEKVKQWRKDYHERHKKDPNYILTINLRKRMLKELGKKNNRHSTIEYLGCSIGELRTYLEGKFQDGMNWENHGLKGWHIDHIIPIAFFDLNDTEQRKKAFHYSNLQPLWWMDNIKKADKIIQNAN